MLAVAPLVGEDDAGGARLVVRVARVRRRVPAEPAPGARVGAGGRAHAARHRRQDDLLAAVAEQLVEGDVRAGLAGAPVAGVLAAVATALEQLAADQRTGVVLLDAARLPALVATARTLLVAPVN